MMDQRIMVGGEDITDEVEAEFSDELSNNIIRGNLSQNDIAKFNYNNPHAMIDGLGEVRLSIDEDIFHAMRVDMKKQMKDPDYECWQDKEFCDYVWKNHPEYRGVNSNKIVSSKGLLV